MQPPRAHVNQSRGSKNSFGQDKQHFKTYKRSRKSIYNRKLVNIDDELLKTREFEHVRITKKKVSDIKSGATPVKCGGFDNSKPFTFKLVKKLTERKTTGSFQMNEHLANLASLQQRITKIGSLQDRKKNPFDPISNPSLFFRRDGQSSK